MVIRKGKRKQLLLSLSWLLLWQEEKNVVCKRAAVRESGC